MAMLDTLHRLPDLIVLTEKWLNCDTVDLYNIQGYICNHTMRDDRNNASTYVLLRFREVI